MRWLASGFFFVVAAGLAYMAWRLFDGVFDGAASDSDTAPGVWITMGGICALFAFGAVVGGIWVFRHWRDRYS